jgi:hypothetical protein
MTNSTAAMQIGNSQTEIIAAQPPFSMLPRFAVMIEGEFLLVTRA